MASDPEAGVNLLRENALGREIASFQVFGVNSLKTLVPLDSLVGSAINDAVVHEGKIELTLEAHAVRVDLQRAGSLVWVDESMPAAAQPRLSTITARIAFVGGGVVAFVEPARTKRIAFWITDAGAK